MRSAYNAAISCVGHWPLALGLLEAMPVEPDTISVNAAITACASPRSGAFGVAKLV